MAYGLSNGHVTADLMRPRRCCEAVWSAILATAWLLVIIQYKKCDLRRADRYGYVRRVFL